MGPAGKEFVYKKELRDLRGSIKARVQAGIDERVKAGMAAAKHKGTRIGRPKISVDQKRARKLHSSGFSQRAIAEVLRDQVAQNFLRLFGSVEISPGKP